MPPPTDYACGLLDFALLLGSYEPMLIKHQPSHYLKMMYLESTSYTVPGARCAFETVGADHFVFGTDSPPLFVLKSEGVDLIKKHDIRATNLQSLLATNCVGGRTKGFNDDLR